MFQSADGGTLREAIGEAVGDYSGIEVLEEFAQRHFGDDGRLHPIKHTEPYLTKLNIDGAILLQDNEPNVRECTNCESLTCFEGSIIINDKMVSEGGCCSECGTMFVMIAWIGSL